MVQCTDCQKEFSSAEGLQHHQEAKHGIQKKLVMKKNSSDPISEPPRMRPALGCGRIHHAIRPVRTTAPQVKGRSRRGGERRIYFERALNILPKRIPQRANDHTSAHRRVISQFSA